MDLPVATPKVSLRRAGDSTGVEEFRDQREGGYVDSDGHSEPAGRSPPAGANISKS